MARRQGRGSSGEGWAVALIAFGVLLLSLAFYAAVMIGTLILRAFNVL